MRYTAHLRLLTDHNAYCAVIRSLEISPAFAQSVVAPAARSQVHRVSHEFRRVTCVAWLTLAGLANYGSCVHKREEALEATREAVEFTMPKEALRGLHRTLQAAS